MRHPSLEGSSAGGRAGVGDWLRMIRFSHSIFALPFALIALLVATDGRPTVIALILILLAMIFARSAAMAYNRWADRELDARNPRTVGRELPRGVLSAGAVLGFALVCAAGFVAVSFLLGPACGWLSIPVLGVLLGYSHAKRFTSFAHLWLGVALGLAAPAAWVAARGAFTADLVAPVVLGSGVAVWVAGFDVLYALQDETFDAQEGLFSIPARFGRRRAMKISRALHVLAVVAFAAFGWLAGLGGVYYAGIGLVAALLAYEHRLVRPDDLGRIDMAFFTMNGAVGLAMLALTAVDLYLI